MTDRDPAPFRDRLARRAELWWETRTPGIHGPRRCHALRRADDPDDLWKCCPYWQRKLSNKWNARAFAERHGVRVPRLHWAGRDVEAIPFDTLPEVYVIRLTSGYGGKQIAVMHSGVNLLDGKAYDRGQIRQRFADLLAAAFSSTLMLVEDYVPPLGARVGLPPDYRFHMFGDVVGLVAISGGMENFAFRTAAWTPLPFPFSKPHSDYPWPPPKQLARMIELAGRLGRAYETYVRVDFYDAEDEPVFAEFSPMPARGRAYTEEANAYLGELWERHFPGRL